MTDRDTQYMLEEAPLRTIVSLDANDPVESIMIDMVLVNRKKRADYAKSDNPFSNFDETAAHTHISSLQAVEALVSTKQSRISNLLEPGRVPKNESLEDSLLDRAVYSVLALGVYRRDNR